MCDSTNFLTLENTQRTHVVQSIGKLYQYDSDIAGHCDGHFLKVFSLFELNAIKLNVGEF